MDMLPLDMLPMVLPLYIACYQWSATKDALQHIRIASGSTALSKTTSASLFLYVSLFWTKDVPRTNHCAFDYCPCSLRPLHSIFNYLHFLLLPDYIFLAQLLFSAQHVLTNYSLLPRVTYESLCQH